MHGASVNGTEVIGVVRTPVTEKFSKDDDSRNHWSGDGAVKKTVVHHGQ